MGRTASFLHTQVEPSLALCSIGCCLTSIHVEVEAQTSVVVIDSHTILVLQFLWKDVGHPFVLPFGFAFGTPFSIRAAALGLPVGRAIWCIGSQCLWLCFSCLLFRKWHQVKANFIGLQCRHDGGIHFQCIIWAPADVHVRSDQVQEHLTICLQDLL